MNARFDKLRFLLCCLGMRSPPLVAGSEIENDHASLDSIVLTSLIIHLLRSQALGQRHIMHHATQLTHLKFPFLNELIEECIVLRRASGWGSLTCEPAPPWRPCTLTTWAWRRCRRTTGRSWAAEAKDWCVRGRWGWELSCGRCTTGGTLFPLPRGKKTRVCSLTVFKDVRSGFVTDCFLPHYSWGVSLSDQSWLRCLSKPISLVILDFFFVFISVSYWPRIYRPQLK